MTALLINNEKISELKKFAEQNPLSLEECRKIITGELPPPGERQGYTIYLEPCWKLVYSIGIYPKRTEGHCAVRHMSMSLTKPGRVPNPTAIQLISDALGFPPLDQCFVTCENEIVEVMAEIPKPQ